MTSPCRNPARLDVAPRPASFNVPCKSTRLPCHAGARPNKMPVNTATRPENRSTSGSRLISAARGILSPARFNAASFLVDPIIVDGRLATDTGVRVLEETTALDVSVTMDFRAGTVQGKTLDFDNNSLLGA